MMYYYKKVKDGVIVSVESKSVKVASPNFIETTKAEYDSFIASLPVIEAEPPRNLEAEIDGIKERLTKIEKR